MKRKFSSMGRVAIALVLALSFSLVTAVPVGAVEPETVVLGGDVATGIGAEGSSEFYIGSGSWHAFPGNKIELYIAPTVAPFDSLGAFTIDEIQSISFATKNVGTVNGVDFYFSIYTMPFVGDDAEWYGYRLTGEAMYSTSYTPIPNQWNVWTTDTGTNEVVFSDHARAPIGFYGAPTLADIQADPIDWNYWSSGAPVTSIDYGVETVKYITFATGNPWCQTFDGLLDEIIIELTTGVSLTIDLEEYYNEVWVDDDATGDWYTLLGNFATIQEGIDNVAPSGTVNVAAGTYYETIDVSVDGLTIQSLSGDPSDTIIDADGFANVVTITDCSGVTLSGFTLKGANPPSEAGGSGDGLYMLDVSGCSISNVVVTDIGGAVSSSESTWAGIKLENSADNIFDLVTVSDIEAFESYGIRVVDWNQEDRSYGNKFSSTTISGITGGKTAVGIYVCRSSSNSFDSTEITTINVLEHSYGPMYSRGIEMVIAEQNTFTSTEISGITSTPIGISPYTSEESSGICLRSGAIGNTFSGYAISGLTGANNNYGIKIRDGANGNSFSGGSISGAQYGVYVTGDCPSNSIHYTNIVGNTEYGAYSDTVTLDATNNWWGHSSGPSGEDRRGSGDAISTKVDPQPWLLEVEGLTAENLRYDKTVALNSGWTIVSPGAELDNAVVATPYTIVDYSDLVLTYDKDGWTEIFELDPITPVFIKTVDGGGIGFNYAEDSQGIFTTDLEAGWNLIGIPETGALKEAILSPIRLGANNEVALATLASQGNYNPSEVTFCESMLETGVPGLVSLHPFDGYWAYMNVAKEFGVVVIPVIPDGPEQN